LVLAAATAAARAAESAGCVAVSGKDRREQPLTAINSSTLAADLEKLCVRLQIETGDLHGKVACRCSAALYLPVAEELFSIIN
jgi:hypothetical protein